MLVITWMFTDRTGLHSVLLEQPRPQGAFPCPTSKAREKRPGNEVAISITYETIIAKKKQPQSKNNVCCYVYASQCTWNVLKLALQSKYFGLQISNGLKKKLSIGVIDFKLA